MAFGVATSLIFTHTFIYHLKRCAFGGLDRRWMLILRLISFIAYIFITVADNSENCTNVASQHCYRRSGHVVLSHLKIGFLS